MCYNNNEEICRSRSLTSSGTTEHGSVKPTTERQFLTNYFLKGIFYYEFLTDYEIFRTGTDRR